MAATGPSDFTITVEADPGTPQRRSNSHSSGGASSSVRSAAVADALTTINRSSPRKGNPRRTACIVIGSVLFLVAVLAAVGYVFLLRPDEGSSDSTPDGNLENVNDSDISSRSGSTTEDSAGNTFTGTVLAPTEEDSPAVAPASNGAAGTAGASATNTTATATQPSPAPVPVPAPVLAPVPVNPKLGFYEDPIQMGVIPVAAAVLPSGKVLVWSAEQEDDYNKPADRYTVTGDGSGLTYHAQWDPATNKVTPMLVSNTQHDMFCPGITMLQNGDIIVTGGQNAKKTSIYSLAEGAWKPAADMHISRGYGSSCLLSDGRVFVLGGSWSGPKTMPKDAEIYDPTLGTYTELPGLPAKLILTNDPEDVEKGFTYRADNYPWLFPWSNGTVFHAGPSTTMHWFSTDGQGSALTAGTRPGGNSANGNAVMYHTGKILACGGSEAFALEDWPATTEASLITIVKSNFAAQVKVLKPMNKERVYANGCVLPDGKVLITGGASKPKEFSDQFAHYQPEIWDPATETFTLLEATHKVARTYHSVGVLLPDGRVFTGGGGLCGDRCDVNHLDAEIFNPPYLFNPNGSPAPRPKITLSATTASHGGTFKVTPTEQLMSVSMIRMGSATHSTNTDQRRIELCGPMTTPCSVGPVSVTIPADPGISLPGNWMIFGVNADGVPSVASILLVGK